MPKLLKRIAVLVLWTLVVSMVPIPAAASTVVQPTVSPSSGLKALDTVANFGTQITGNGFVSGEEVAIEVKKPDGSTTSLTVAADAAGKISVGLSENDTILAGTYMVQVPGKNQRAVFQVFPSDMSLKRSSMYTSKASVGANGVDFAKVTVRLVDDFGNPLEYHEVKLTSSRSADRISATSVETNSKGLAEFLVSSRDAGVSTLAATDESVGETLTSRLNISFMKAKEVFRAVGGDPETVLLAQAGQTVSQFLIENIPATVNLNETISFRVVAADASGNTVSSYTGSILFSSTDPNAQLPNAYTFQASNQGRKTFDLGLSFRTAGSQKLTVQQQGNALIKGEKTVEVVSAPGGGSGQVRITKPATGTYSVNTLEVAGEASPNANVKIFDNGQQVAEVQANSTGRFSYSMPLLTDGQHTFHAESNGVQSTPVTVTIDSTPAQVEQVDISETNLPPGGTAQISIRSDPDLNAIQATVGEFITDLEADPQNPGLYRGTLTAPAQDGEYTVNVIITDSVGNVSPAVEVGKLRVDAGLTPDAPVSFDVPSKVQGVSAVPGNNRVTLTWQAAQAESGIAVYRIYYGTDSTKLNLIVNTIDSKTTWYIPNLQNGTKYYFQIVGVDGQGNEGDNRSDMVNATPSASLSNEPSTPPVLCDPGPCPPDVSPPPRTPQDGPGVLGMIIASLFGGSVVRFVRKRRP